MDIVGEQTLEVMSKAKFYNKWLFDQIKPFVGGDILEIGSGIGNFSKKLSSAGTLTGIDYSSDYVRLLGNLKLTNAKFGQGDIEKGEYFFGQKKFHTIVCMNVLEHIKNDGQALKNMFDLLRVGGRLILLVPAHQEAYSLMDKNLGHFRRYDRKSIEKKLSQANFSITKTFYLNFLGLLGWWFNGKVLNKKVLPGTQLEVFDTIARPFLKIENIVKPPLGLSVVSIATK